MTLTLPSAAGSLLPRSSRRTKSKNDAKRRRVPAARKKTHMSHTASESDLHRLRYR
jgi:hypothetical protein